MNNFIDENTVFLLDSYGLIFREYYAFFSHPLTNSKGENISALFGYFRNLSILFKTYKPKYFVAAFDSRTPTFRHEQFSDYKANRKKTPDDLKSQFPMIEECLSKLGVNIVRKDGYEADDVIATIANECKKVGRHCVILSADKDLQQLACDSIHLLKPDKVKTWIEATEEDVENEWGVKPEIILDFLSLTGDSADNVPGVQGVGDKTALKLLNEYGTLENILENAEKIKGALGEKIRRDKENALLSKKLITLCKEVPLDNLNIDELSKVNLTLNEFSKEMTKRELPAISKAYKELASIFGEKEISSSSENIAEIEDENENHLQIELKKNEGDYKACTDLGELIDFVEEILKTKVCAFDTETDSLNTREANLVGFSLAYQKGKGIYVPLILNENPLFAPSLISKKNALQQLERIFFSDCKIIMHNAKFDIEVLASNGLDPFEISGENGQKKTNINGELSLFEEEYSVTKKFTLFDTMIAAWLTEPDKSGKSPYSLETLAEEKLGLKGTEYSELVGKNQTFADVKLSEAAKYGAEDSDFTFQLYEYYALKLDEENLKNLFENLEMKVLPVLAKMELEGIHLDSSILQKYELELKTQILKQEKLIYEEAGYEFNIASPKQLSKLLFEERGLKHGKKTKTGYSTDTDVLESLAEEDAIPQMILDYRAKAKLLSTYVETLPILADNNGRVHTSFMQTGTATGRLSSKDPNLQNIPVRSEEGRKIRSAFTAPDKKVLISADYAQIELVVLAHLSGDKNLCDAFVNGIDVHKSTASLIYKVPAEEVTADMRRNAKTLNFGLMYGMSAFRLAKDLQISRTEAQDFINKYFESYKGVRDFFEKNVQEAQTNGFITTISGRKRKIAAINSPNKKEVESAVRIAKNSPIQGSAADIVKIAMIEVENALTKNKIPCRLLLQVHDELIFECDEDEKTVQKAIEIITQKMENAVHLRVPLRVSVEYGKSWGEFH